MTLTLVSPVTGATLVEDDAGLLRDADGRRWPCIDGIPYLRVAREALVADAVDRLDRGDRNGALAVLLADQDDWWTGTAADPGALRRLVHERDRLSLREAMDLLAFDRVGHYFAHRWSDPTFMAGLGLLEAHWRSARTSFELACGIGHYGRALMQRGIAYTGADVVFSKLWLARHWVLPPAARLVCFDAAAPWPVPDNRYDLVFCHDAFYFLEPKLSILATLRSVAGDKGRLALGHVHNSGAENLSSGHAVSAAAMAQLFPDATVYDDAELTRAVVEARAPHPAQWAELDAVEAFSVEDRRDLSGSPRVLGQGLSMPGVDATLRLNPLYRPRDEGYAIAWPSPRYEAEYGGRATYPGLIADDRFDSEAVRRRILVDLPERW